MRRATDKHHALGRQMIKHVVAGGCSLVILGAHPTASAEPLVCARVYYTVNSGSPNYVLVWLLGLISWRGTQLIEARERQAWRWPARPG